MGRVMQVFVVGNGVTRKQFDLNRLIGHGKIVICNEAYREFNAFDIIASVDGPSTTDIKSNCNLSNKTHIYKWKNNWFINGNDMGQLIGSFNSGQLAMMGAIEQYDPDTIYLLGIDFGGHRLFTGKNSAEPSNKCWDTWQKLMAGRTVYNVTTRGSVPDKIKGKTISYKDFNGHLLSWERDK